MKYILYLIFTGFLFISSSPYAQTIFNPNLTYGKIKDVDGNIYKTIQIGSQTWMAENLKTTKYQNGAPVAYIKDAKKWNKDTSGGWCYYNNDPSLNISYGKLYNWFVVENEKNICPTGWHIPSDEDWNTLIGYLDYDFLPDAIESQSSVAGDQLKSTGNTFWKYSNEGTNTSGFSAIPGAYRTSDGGFTVFNKEGYWWSSTPAYTNFAWYRSLHNKSSSVYRNYLNKTAGFSIRCVKD